jgi:hypothetical protein
LAGNEHELTVSSPQPPGFLLVTFSLCPRILLLQLWSIATMGEDVVKGSLKAVIRTMTQENQSHGARVNKGQVVTRAKETGKAWVMNS